MRRKGGQLGYPVVPRTGPRTYLTVTFYPTTADTRCTFVRRGGPSDGPDGTRLAACHIDVTRADLEGLDTRAASILLSAALCGPIAAHDWRLHGCPPGPPQIVIQEALDFD